MSLRVRWIQGLSLQVCQAQNVSEFSKLTASVVRSLLKLRVLARSPISRDLAPLVTRRRRRHRRFGPRYVLMPQWRPFQRSDPNAPATEGDGAAAR